MTTADTAPTAAAPADGLEGVRFAVIDLETSGLSPRHHQVLQVAVLVTDAQGQPLDAYSSLVRPRHGLLSRVGPRRIHGITRWSLRGAPHPGDVLVELAPRLQGTVVVGHNLAFDVAFLRRLGERTGVALPLGPQLCTLQLSRSLDPDRRLRHRLGDLCERYGIEHHRPHDARDDAAATAALLPHLLAAAGITDAGALERLLAGRSTPPAARAA